MTFMLVCIGSLVGLAIIAATASHFQGGSDEITTGHDCSSCVAADDGSCQLHCLMEEKKAKEGQ